MDQPMDRQTPSAATQTAAAAAETSMPADTHAQAQGAAHPHAGGDGITREFQLRLAGRDYMVRRLPYEPEQRWREEFEAPLQEITGAIAKVADLVDLPKPGEEPRERSIAEQIQRLFGTTEIGLGDVVRLVGQLGTRGNALLRQVYAMVYAYAPVLEADRARLEATAMSEEMLLAFLTIARVALPFGDRLLTLGTSLQQRMAAQPQPQAQAPSAAPASHERAVVPLNREQRRAQQRKPN